MEIDEEWEDDIPPGLCCIGCGAYPSILGTCDLRWCEECQHRERFIAWGLSHGWPELACLPYTVTAGKKQWMLAVASASTSNNDDLIYHALLFMDYLEKERAA